MMTPEERYLRDTEFKMLVDIIYSWIVKCQYTPTEVREAAMLAAVKHSMNSIPNMIDIPEGLRNIPKGLKHED